MIHRRLDDHLVALLREAMQGEGDAFHDARHVAKPLPLDLPVMLVVHPVDNALVIFVRGVGVAKHLMLTPFTDRLDDKVGRAEVHVGHPERHQVLLSESGLQLVHFHAAGASPVDDLIKVVVFHDFIGYIF